MILPGASLRAIASALALEIFGVGAFAAIAVPPRPSPAIAATSVNLINISDSYRIPNSNPWGSWTYGPGHVGWRLPELYKFPTFDPFRLHERLCTVHVAVVTPIDRSREGKGGSARLGKGPRIRIESRLLGLLAERADNALMGSFGKRLTYRRTAALAA